VFVGVARRQGCCAVAPGYISGIHDSVTSHLVERVEQMRIQNHFAIGTAEEFDKLIFVGAFPARYATTGSDAPRTTP
jgi:hypothetical protein